MTIDGGAIASEVIADAPAVLKLLEEAVDLYKQWKDGSDAEKSAAEAQANTAMGAMQGVRDQTKADHDARTAETQKIIDALEHPPVIAPPKLGE